MPANEVAPMVRKSILSRMRSKKKIDPIEVNSPNRAPIGSSRKDRVSASASVSHPDTNLERSGESRIDLESVTRNGKTFLDKRASVLKDRDSVLQDEAVGNAFEDLEPVDPKKFRELLKLERETPRQASPEKRHTPTEQKSPKEDVREAGASAIESPPLRSDIQVKQADLQVKQADLQSKRGILESLVEAQSQDRNALVQESMSQEVDTPAKRRFMPSPGQSREEVLTKIREGFTGLNNVLSDIGRKLEAHNDRSDELVRSVHTIPQLMKDLPENSRNGVQLLNTISGALETQTSVTREMVDRIGALAEQVRRLPEALQHVSEKLDRQDLTTQRIDQSVTHVKEAVVAMQAESSRIHRETLNEFRRSQDADREQVQKTLEKDRDMLRAMMDRTTRQGQFMMVLTVVLILAFLAALSKL